jgi:hypothetical protein
MSLEDVGKLVTFVRHERDQAEDTITDARKLLQKLEDTKGGRGDQMTELIWELQKGFQMISAKFTSLAKGLEEAYQKMEKAEALSNHFVAGQEKLNLKKS